MADDLAHSIVKAASHLELQRKMSPLAVLYWDGSRRIHFDHGTEKSTPAMVLGCSISYAYNCVVSRERYVALEGTDPAMEIMKNAFENDPHGRNLIGVFRKVLE